MTEPHFKMVVATHLFLINGNTILLAKRSNTGYEDGKFSVPAGHVDGNETIIQATIREAKEEIGVIIKDEDLQFAEVFHRQTSSERIDFFFACSQWTGKPKINEPEKCSELRWSDLQTLPMNTVPYIRTAICAYQAKTPYLELDY